MATHDPAIDPSSLPLPLPLLPILARSLSLSVLYALLHLIADRILFHVVLPRLTNRSRAWLDRNVSRSDRIDFAEKICSTTNAVVTAVVGTSIVFFSHPPAYSTADTLLGPFVPRPGVAGPGASFWQRPLAPFTTVEAHDGMVQAILGYQMYDLITMWVSGSHWTFWIHHGVVGTHALLYLSSSRTLSFLGLVWSPCELTAIAHNSVWYYQTVRKYTHTGTSTSELPSSASPKNTPSLDTDTAPLLVTDSSTSTSYPPPTPLQPPPAPLTLLLTRFIAFLLFRTWLAPYVLYHCLTTSGGVGPFFKDLWRQGSGAGVAAPLFLVSVCVSVLAMTGLNVVWTWAAYKSYRSAFRKHHASTSNSASTLPHHHAPNPQYMPIVPTKIPAPPAMEAVHRRVHRAEADEGTEEEQVPLVALAADGPGGR